MADIKLNFVIACDNAFVSQGNSSLNLIGIFDRINASAYPLVYPRIMLVTSLSGMPKSYNQVISLKDKNSGKIIAELSGKMDILTLGQKAQFIGSFFNIVFPNPGEYIFEVRIDDVLQDLNTSIFVK